MLDPKWIRPLRTSVGPLFVIPLPTVRVSPAVGGIRVTGPFPGGRAQTPVAYIPAVVLPDRPHQGLSSEMYARGVGYPPGRLEGGKADASGHPP